MSVGGVTILAVSSADRPTRLNFAGLFKPGGGRMRHSGRALAPAPSAGGRTARTGEAERRSKFAPRYNPSRQKMFKNAT